MKIVYKILSVLFWVLLVWFVLFVSQLFIFDVIPGVKKEILISGFVAFFGAFFAYLFTQIAQLTKERRKRNWEHYDTLVKFEHVLNKVIFTLDKNIYSLGDNIAKLKEMKVLIISYYPIQFKDDLLLGLKNIDLMNDLFSLSLEIENINRDLQISKDAYYEIKNNFLQGRIKPEDYKFNVLNSVKEMEKLLVFMKHSNTKLIRYCAIVRLLIKDRKFGAWLFGPIPRKHYQRKFEADISKEIDVLKAEINETQGESRREIEELERSMHSQSEPESEPDKGK